MDLVSPLHTSMDIDAKPDKWIIRNPKTHEPMGYWIHNWESYIEVPENGEVEHFLKEYNALSNYDMGLTIERFNSLTNLVDGFFILYGFIIGREVDGATATLENGDRVYTVRSEPLTNLDMLEILYFHQEKADSVKKYSF